MCILTARMEEDQKSRIWKQVEKILMEIMKSMFKVKKYQGLGVGRAYSLHWGVAKLWSSGWIT